MWNADRGYGFISNDAGGPDMFLHISALHAAGIDPDNILLRLKAPVRERRGPPTFAGRAERRKPGKTLFQMARKLKQAGWSYAEDCHLLELAKSSKSPKEIARLMNRSTAAVYKMAIRLGVPLRPVEPGPKAKTKP